MILHRYLYVLNPEGSELRESKVGRGLIGADDEDQLTGTHTGENHIGKWWRKWLRFA